MSGTGLPNIFPRLPFKDSITIRARSSLRQLILDAYWYMKGAEQGPEYMIPNADDPVYHGFLADKDNDGSEWACKSQTHYTEIDDPPGAPDDDTTYLNQCMLDPHVYTEAKGMSVPSLPAQAHISKINHLTRAKWTDPQPGYNPQGIIRLYFRIDGSFYLVKEWEELVPDYTDMDEDVLTDPSNGESWENWMEADLARLGLGISMTGHSALKPIRYTQIYFSVYYFEPSTDVLITVAGGRVRFERQAAGAADHVLKNLFASTDWSGYTHLRFDLQKVAYAGAVGLKVGLYSGGSLYSVDIDDYCLFASSTKEAKVLIPLADFVTAGADLTDIEGVAFTADGDSGDYDFYIEGMEAVKLDGNLNDEQTTTDTTVTGFADIKTGALERIEPGDTEARVATFLLPKGTTIDNNDYLVFGGDEYRVTGVNNDIETHIEVTAVYVEVWVT